MSDMEIHDLISNCRIKSDVPWDVLVARFSKQLVALSDRLTEEELYSLMEVAIACYQKGYDEFAAAKETEFLIRDMKRRSCQGRRNH